MKLNKVFHNAKWIIVCKVIQSLLQLLVGMLCARYLGPENYGLVNYAGSVVAFVIPFVNLGLNATLVQELIESPDKEGEIMGTSVLLSILSSFAGIILIGIFVSFVNAGEKETVWICFLYSLSLIFLSVELMQYWFHSKLNSKYPSIMMLVSYVVVSAYKITILVLQKNIYWFAVVHSIEYGIIGLALLGIYFWQGSQRLSFSAERAKKLLRRSKYYILSSVMVTVFQHTDHIMLKIISGDAENGLYSAAITCTTICQFVYLAIIDSFRPDILSQKKAGSSSYKSAISRLYCIIISLALLQSIGFSVFAKPIIYILYGADYRGAIPVLRILVWYMAFSCIGVIRNIWIMAEEKQNLLWKINLAGIVVNVCINALLIPVWGASGAAVASLVTQFTANFALGFVYKPLRENNMLLLQGIRPGFVQQELLPLLGEVLKNKKKNHNK